MSTPISPVDWLSQTEVRAAFGFRPSQLEKWRRSCLVLGHPIETKSVLGSFQYRRQDLETIRQAIDTPPADRFTDGAGEEWGNRHVIEAPPFGFPYTRAMKMAGYRGHQQLQQANPATRDARPFLLLDADRLRRPRAKQVPVHNGRGFQRVWYFHLGDYAAIRSNLDRGVVESRRHGPGLTEAEVREAFGVSGTFLDNHEVPSWREARVCTRGPSDGEGFRTPMYVRPARVYDEARVQELLDGPGSRHLPEQQRRRREAAVSFLRDLLAGGRVKASEVQRRAHEAGHSEHFLRLAHRKLGVAHIWDPRERCWYWNRAGEETPLDRAKRFLERMTADGPALAVEVQRRAKEQRISDHKLRQAALGLGILKRHRLQGPSYWCPPGAELPAEELDQAAAAEGATPDSRADVPQTLPDLRTAPPDNLPDGPVPPDKLRFRGQLYDGFVALEYRLLRCLWGKESVEVLDAIEAVYGADANSKEKAFSSLVKRVRERCLNHGGFWEIHSTAGHIWLEILTPPTKQAK
jgi:hypothetical protein